MGSVRKKTQSIASSTGKVAGLFFIDFLTKAAVACLMCGASTSPGKRTQRRCYFILYPSVVQYYLQPYGNTF